MRHFVYFIALFIVLLAALPLPLAGACAPLPDEFSSAHSPPPPHLSTWSSPEEISVAQAFNRLYGTQYDPTTYAGLQAIIDARATQMATTWTIRDVRWLQMLACDTDASPVIHLVVNADTWIEVTSAGPWTSPSRGWFPDKPSHAKPIDLVKLLGSHGFDPTTATFEIAVDSTPMTPTNTLRLLGLQKGHALLAFNGPSLAAGDRDANEPLLLAITDLEWR